MRKVWEGYLIGIALAAVSHAWAKISPNIPVGSPTYAYEEQLEAYYCGRSFTRLVGPQSHADLRESLGLEERQVRRCKAPEWLLQEREFLVRPTLQNEGTISVLENYGDTIPLHGIEAGTTPLYPLREGRASFNGPNLYTEFMASGEAGGDWGLAFSATPGFLLGIDNYRHFDGQLYLQEGYFKVGYKRAEVTFGRTSLRFGDSAHGSLALSGAGLPLDTLKLAVRPHVLGWPFGFLGLFTFETWFAHQGNSAYIQNAYLWGTEIGFRPSPLFEIAFLELYEYGGVGSPGLSLTDYLKMVAYAASNELEAKRAREASIAVSVWEPRRRIKAYAEVLFDSLTRVSRWLSDDSSVLLGLWLPKLEGMDVRLEYVHTVPTAYENSYWKQGFTSSYQPLGSPLGPDAEGAYADLHFYQTATWRPGVGLFYEARSLHPQPGTFTEWRYGLGLNAQRRWDKWELRLDGKYAKAYHHDYQEPQADVWALFGTVRYSFF